MSTRSVDNAVFWCLCSPVTCTCSSRVLRRYCHPCVNCLDGRCYFLSEFYPVAASVVETIGCIGVFTGSPFVQPFAVLPSCTKGLLEKPLLALFSKTISCSAC